jgi:type I restriction enzyme M protein
LALRGKSNIDAAPATFDVVLTNPPFGGKEGKDAQKNFTFETGSTQVLFLQHILEALSYGGRCGIVLDEGLLFRNNESSFVETKRKLLDECDLWCIVSLPGGVFTAAGAGVKTNLLFFTLKGKKTERIWYYDLSHVKVGKKSLMTLANFGFARDGSVLDDRQLPVVLTAEWRKMDETQGKPFPSFARMFAHRATPEGDSAYSWTIDFVARRAKAREDMSPHLEEVERLKIQIVGHKEKLKDLKKSKATEEEINTLMETIRITEKTSREAQAKADSIDAAMFHIVTILPEGRGKRQ